MNKRELAAQVAKGTGLTQAQTSSAVAAIVAARHTTVKAGGEVVLVGLGTFSVADRTARVGRNPATGEAIKIAAFRAVKFKPGKTLKEAVNVKAKKKGKGAKNKK